MTVKRYATNVRYGHGDKRKSRILFPGGARANAHAMAVRPLSNSTVMPNAAAEAAILARNSVRVGTGNGARTMTSRRSGNVASHDSTPNSPTANIVVAIKKCSIVQQLMTSVSRGMRE